MRQENTEQEREPIVCSRGDSKAPLGLLLLHGFTASRKSLQPLAEGLGGFDMPIAFPLLRGHGQASPEALRGIRWPMWLDDARRALLDLATKARRIIIIGHSMGSLLALSLAATHPRLVDSLVLVTPPMRLASLLAPGRPLHPVAPMVAMLFKRWEIRPVFADPESALPTGTYPWAPTDAILSFFDLIEEVSRLLGSVSAPVTIIHSRRDTTVRAESAARLCEGLPSGKLAPTLFWLERSDHQVFCDGERGLAINAVAAHIERRRRVVAANL